MGAFGSTFFEFNFKIFGLLSYLYPLGAIYLSYFLYQEKKITLRFIELCFAGIFFAMLLLILQFLSIGFGVFGGAVVAYLKPYLGVFGVWILCILGILTCFVSFGNQDIVQIFRNINFSAFWKHTGRAFSKVFLGLTSFGKKIFAFLRSKFSFSSLNLKSKWESCKNLLKPQITQSPFMELPQNTEVDLKNLLPSIEPITSPKQISLTKQKEKSMSEKIDIQEFIITPKREEKKSQIRVLDNAQPQRENPFLNTSFALGKSQGISTSAELLKKIKDQDFVSTPSDVPPYRDASLDFAPDMSMQDLSRPSPFDVDIQTPIQGDISSISSEISMRQTEIQEQECEIHQDEANIECLSQESFKDPLPPQHEDFKFSSHIPQASKVQDSSTPARSRVAHIKTLRENEALLQEIDQGVVEIPKDYKLPPIDLLAPAPKQDNEIDENEIDLKIQNLLEKLSVFKIDGDVVCTYSGPIITTLEFRPAPNVKVSRIQSLENDLAMALEAKSIRIQAPIPGKNVVGIEIPNSSTQTIYLREIFESEIFKNSSSPLTLALGKDVVGNPFITDLKKLPHLLIAGTTGSGKSVGVNAMILSLLYRNSPDDLKLMMVDPKMVEFMPYSDLPHLITPIITDPKKAVIGLANAVREMERRYTLMSQTRTKEIVSYNQKAEELGLEKFPYFVIIIDELADLMMTAGKEVEYSMARIAQMGRASGMHLIVATQSPRAEVLTGLIKTNLPAHLSYKVGTKIDAGIIGCAGAETLLGRGDMLFTPPGVSGLVRLHAPWSSEDEVNEIIAFIKNQREVVYDPQFLPEEKESFGAFDPQEMDSETAMLIEQAKQIMLQDGKTSGSHIQRRLRIGYNKAANLIELLEQQGFLSAPDAKGNRQILH